MTKSIREMEKSLKLVDFVVYIVDSRAPWSCQNPEFDNLFAKLPIVYVLNKLDLGNLKVCQDWLNSKNTDTSISIAISSIQSNQAKLLVPQINRLCSNKLDKFRAKNINMTLRGIVVGVPNVGKSTFINNLSGSKKTKTGNIPGVTRGQQWVKIDNYLNILDTPGTLYPKLSDDNVAINLAIIGSIRDQVLDMIELSHALILKLQKIDSSILINKYECFGDMSCVQVLEQIAKKRAFVLKGGIIDTERASLALIDDFRKGRLGKISLDIPT